MSKIRFDETNKIIVKTEKNKEIAVNYSLATALAAEDVFGSLIKMYEGANNLDGCIKLLLILVNTSIENYNKRYNQSEMPLEMAEIVDGLGLNDNVNSATRVMIYVKEKLFKDAAEIKKK